MAVGDIDVAAATAALNAQGGLPETIPTHGVEYNRDGHGRFASKEEPTTEAVTPDPSAVAEQSTPAQEPAQPEATPEQRFDFTSITDEAILSGDVTPQQLVAMRRAMNADYTQKQQEAAPWRKLAGDLGIESPEDLRAAGELFTQLQDPRNWPQFQQELTQHMMDMGMTPQAASRAAADQLAEFAPSEEYDNGAQFVDDGSGVAQQLAQMQQQIAQLTQGIQQRDQQAELLERQNAIAVHLTQQEDALRKTRGYDDGAMEAIYSLMGPDADLNAAANRFDSIIGSQVQAYINSKAQAIETTPQAAVNTAVIAEQPPKPMSWEEAHRAALAHVERVEV